MQNTFTIHCIPWTAGALLLQEIRVAARQMGLLENVVALSDDSDKQCRHALALSQSGGAIGCARISTDGQIDRLFVISQKQRSKIEAGLTEVLNDYAQQQKDRSPSVSERARIH
jgi:hypothetical protein